MVLQEALNETVNVIDKQEWLEPASDVVQRAANDALTGGNTRRQIDNLLNGVWLGHPLHPVLTDVPVGAWTVTIALDAVETFTGRTDFIPGADAALAIGLGGALGSAVSGLAQWQYTDSRSRRLGLAHALMNVGATVLYGASLVCRIRGARRAGKITGALGYVIVSVSAYLGGDLVYAQRIGVDHTTENMVELPTEFTPAMADADLPPNMLKRANVQGMPVLLVRQNDTIYALAAVCSHLGGPLDEGQLGDCSVTCPWHASQFALDDGRVLNGPASFPQPHFETRVRNGQIEVRRITLDSPDGR